MTKIETDDQQYKITVTRSDNTAVKIVSILALCGFFTTVFTLAIVFGDIGPWVTIGLLALSLHPSIRDRISGKYGNGRLEDRLTLLEMKLAQTEQQLLDAQHQLVILEEGAEFERKIGVRGSEVHRSDDSASAAELLALTITSSEKPNS